MPSDHVVTTRVAPGASLRLHHLKAVLKEAENCGASTVALVKADNGKVSISWTKD